MLQHFNLFLQEKIQLLLFQSTGHKSYSFKCQKTKGRILSGPSLWLMLYVRYYECKVSLMAKNFPYYTSWTWHVLKTIKDFLFDLWEHRYKEFWTDGDKCPETCLFRNQHVVKRWWWERHYKTQQLIIFVVIKKGSLMFSCHFRFPFCCCLNTQFISVHPFSCSWRKSWLTYTPVWLFVSSPPCLFQI